MNLEDSATEQVERFVEAGFKPYPSAGMQSALIRAFCELCVGTKHLTATGDWLIRNRKFFPQPADIVEAVQALADASAQPKEHNGQRRNCPQCGDTGYSQVWELHTYRGSIWSKETQRITEDRYRELRHIVDGNIGRGQVVTSAVEPCKSCPLGRSLVSNGDAE